jgi:glycosyltransferase involved in cell wall biosynthesis
MQENNNLQNAAASNREATFAILMCTYNGEPYLSRQMRSFIEQTNRDWRLHISDDGSTDHTLKIIDKFRTRVGDARVTLKHGPRTGFAQNFMSLLCNQSIQAKYYALSDQDDIWEPGKLDAALDYFKKINPIKPALYCGRTIFVDHNDKYIGLSSPPHRKLTFQNALVQNIASGNTMVINDAARRLLIQCGGEMGIFAHDWLIYLLVSGYGGDIYYDERPFVRYRQHGQNVIGMNSSMMNKFARIIQLLHGDFKQWNEKNLDVIKKIRNSLEINNIKTVDAFSEARQSYGVIGCLKLAKAGVYRQKYNQNIALYIGAMLGRL